MRINRNPAPMTAPSPLARYYLSARRIGYPPAEALAFARYLNR